MQKIAILRTDAVLEQFQPEFGDYPQMFTDLLLRLVPDLDIVSYDVRRALPERMDCDAYLITGSRHSVYDDLPWIKALVRFLQEVLAAGKKVIGICFGHQLMAHFFGGRVGPSENGWGVGLQTSQVTPQSWMEGRAPESVGLLASHKDQVLIPPPGAEVFLHSEFCPIGGFTLGQQIVTVQGHPEFSGGYARALMRHRREIIGEPVFLEGMRSSRQTPDADEVFGWMLNFIQQPAPG